MGPTNVNKVTLDYYILLNQSEEVDYIMSAIDCTILPPLSVVSDHKLLKKLKFKWRLKNNVMAPSKSHSYAYLRVRVRNSLMM